ncbi:MAG: DUF86 domain-containing protein [Prevotellaceae bacterium]|jgi:uncharacterized protein with HEPN domain|nr:DUF86 domain-containing protein [Prevotellaceae bacterium]
MRERPRDNERLQHILEAINNIFEFTKGVSFDDFCNNKMLRFAVVKNLEIVGEAAYLLSKEFKHHHPKIEWDDIIAMRHVLVHGYYNIRNERIWAAIITDIPLLQDQIKNIYNKPDSE